MAEPEAGAEAGGRRERRGRRPVNLDQVFDTIQTAPVEQSKTQTNAVGMHFVLAPAGSFEMGSAAAEDGHRTNEGPAHEVVIGRPFYLATTPVTQSTFVLVLGRNPAKFHPDNGGDPQHPVEMVS